jgi:hypothetical protein
MALLSPRNISQPSPKRTSLGSCLLVFVSAEATCGVKSTAQALPATKDQAFTKVLNGALFQFSSP